MKAGVVAFCIIVPKCSAIYVLVLSRFPLNVFFNSLSRPDWDHVVLFSIVILRNWSCVIDRYPRGPV